MRYSGIQPQYFPRLHYIARILNADIFCARDEAQFVRKHKFPDGRVDKSFQANSPIKQSFGVQLLSVPTQHEGLQSIKETKISYQTNWIEEHLKTFQISYTKSPNFKTIYPEIENLLNNKYESLAELNIATTYWSLLHLLRENEIENNMLSLEAVNKELNKQTTFRLEKIFKSSESKSLKPTMSANEKIVALCKELGADEDFCGGTGVAAYIDHDIFERNGIKITVQDWTCQEYPQLFTKQLGFLPNLSILDLLMNSDFETAVRIIKG